MPIDPVYKKLEIDAIISRIDPAMLVLQKRYEGQVSPNKIPMKFANEVLGSKDKARTKPLRLPAKDQVASITFTSGTSGTPKSVPNTHANHAWNIETCSKVWEWDHNDSLLICLPLSHWYGLVMGLSGVIYHGNTLYLRQQSFDAKGVLEDLSSGNISIFTHAPIAYTKMLDVPGDYDLSKTRLFISGSAPFAPQLWRDFKNRFGVEVIETYGSSETGRIAANSAKKKRLGSPGRVLPGVQAKLGPEDELLVKSGGLFPGYWNNAKATAKASAAGGYWRTGDIAKIEDGYVILKGRAQETIRKAGYTVSPRDVEWALLENPNIKEAVVIGTQSPGDTDDKIFYYLAGDITEDEVNDYCKANLPFVWRPDKITLLDAIPRTRNGKPNIRALKEISTK